MLKRVSTFLLATIVVFAVSISAFADTDNVSNRQRQGETFVLPINSVEISENSWVKIGEISDNKTREKSVLYATIHRNATSEECQIYLHWSGSDLYNAWKFTKVVVDNGSALVAKEYGNIAGQTINVPDASIGSVLIGTVDIPTDKTQARVKFSGLKGYNLGSGSWLSAAIVGKLGEIN